MDLLVNEQKRVGCNNVEEVLRVYANPDRTIPPVCETFSIC